MKNTQILELMDFETIIAIGETKWQEICSDYKGTWTNKDQPMFIGKKTVLSGCVSDEIGALLIEGFHFVVVPDNRVDRVYYTSYSGVAYEYINEDDWGRHLFRRLDNDRTYVMVDKSIHSMTCCYGEPISSLTIRYQLKEKGVNYPIDKLLVASSWSSSLKSTIEDNFKYIAKDSFIYDDAADVRIINMQYKNYDCHCVLDATTNMFEINPKYSDERKAEIVNTMELVIPKLSSVSLNRALEEVQFIKPLFVGQ